MTIAYSMINKTKSLLEDNWQLSTQPNVDSVWNRRSTGFIGDKSDQIILTPKLENIEYYSLYGVDHLHEITIDLDIRSYQDIDRHSDVVAEVLRIIKANIRGGNDYVDLRVLSSVSRNERMRNMFNHIVTIVYRVLNP